MRGKAILIAAAVVLVLAGGGAAAYVATKDDDAGSTGEQLLGQEPNSTESETSPAPAPTTPTETTPPASTDTETAPANPPSGTTLDQQSEQQDQSPSSKGDRPSGSVSIPPAHRFSGTGNTRLGTVDVHATSILRWKAKGHFEVRFGREDFSIIAPTKSGQLVVPPFRFDHVRVIASGPWTISVSPQK